MNLNSSESWILKEFGKKKKHTQVPIGNAYQANIPDLLIKERSVNTSNEYNLNSKTVFLKHHLELKSISINLKKLNGSEIKSIKRNLLNQHCERFSAKNRD